MTSMSMSMDTTTEGNRSSIFSNNGDGSSFSIDNNGARQQQDQSTDSFQNFMGIHDSVIREDEERNNVCIASDGQWHVEEARFSLRKAASILSRYGLKVSSKWASEQLIGLAPPMVDAQTTRFRNPLQVDQTSVDNNNEAPQKFEFHQDGEPLQGVDRLAIEEYRSDLEIYAKSLFDLGEYQRTAAVLSDDSALTLNLRANDGIWSKKDMHMKGNMKTSSSAVTTNASGGDFVAHAPLAGLSPFCIFLRSYSLYMAGEKRKEEEVVELRESMERNALKNPYLPQLVSELFMYHEANALDAFALYMYGVVLKEFQKSPATTSHRATLIDGLQIPDAQSIFIESIIKFPYNWSAWLDLSELCVGDPSIHSAVEDQLKPISSHWMYHFFCVNVFLENQANENAIMVIDRLMQGTDEESNGFFVQSPYLQSQLAVAHYNMRDFDTAQNHFVMLAKNNSHRLDQMDVYSNILYVKEDRVGLSQLAHRAVKIDKYRPETCCIIGNYYSLKSQHEKAVQYFQRALKLDRTYLSAWTLMGHEYLEMKNTAAAIEAYRRAVDINPRDYRAWYGLGQTYEIMNMLLYALFYYRKAVELRPYDARMWCAMGGCYLGLERRNDAIRSYERAVSNHDAEGIATKKLATLYREDGNSEQAARCYMRHLELRYQAQTNQSFQDEEVAVGSIINLVHVDAPEAEALLYLAYFHRDHKDLEMASMCCSRLLEYPGPEKEEGKALLREIRSRMDQKGRKKGY